MDRVILRKVQLAEVMILDEIKRICDKHEIRYYLIGGTLLGSIRHKGFIPWDDDLDICMPRDDYNRFADVCKTELGEAFVLQSIDTDPKCNLFITKIRLKNTRLVDRVIADLDIEQGIYVDIFPLDLCNGINNNLKFRAKLFGVLAKLKTVKLGVARKTGCLKNIMIGIARIVTFLIPLKCLNGAVQCVLTKEKTGNMYINFCSQYGYRRQTMPKEWYGEGTSIVFENQMYRVPIMYDKVLTSIYGDYMKLPPVEKQKTVHDFIEVDLGIYDGIIEERMRNEAVCGWIHDRSI